MPWRIVFAYVKGVSGDAEHVYQTLMDAALNYRYARSGLGAVRVNAVDITQAIFDLNNHDTNVPVAGKVVTGQDLKELFITSIFFQGLENQYSDGVGVFFVLPLRAESCDAAVMVAPAETVRAVGTESLRLTADHVPSLFQVKEYFNHARATGTEILTPIPVDVAQLTHLARNHDQETIIYMRDFYNFNSRELDAFFTDNPRCHLIGASPEPSVTFTSLTGEVTTVPLPEGVQNYIIISPDRTFRIASFRSPASLVQ